MPFHQKRRLPGDVSAIFVHAGAGYHSIQNERVHLQACADAAKAAMAFLKNGGSAVDAVEVAIKVLEDKEITNAGYGSNLAMDGTVECDATIVDHLGRSGAVGAVGQILNPVHLARLVLENTTKPMSLRRVPPNLLVGQGAADFAFEQGMAVLPHDCLISQSAKERWQRWKYDLNKARRRASNDKSETPESEEEQKPMRPQTSRSQSSQNRLLAGLQNESQPYSPQPVPSEAGNRAPEFNVPDEVLVTPQSSPLWQQLYTDSAPSPQGWTYVRKNKHGEDGHHSQDFAGPMEDDSDDGSFTHSNPQGTKFRLDAVPVITEEFGRVSRGRQSCSNAAVIPVPPISSHAGDRGRFSEIDGRADDITDTVGAIAVDCFGNIAAGSSSGGIGMKHKGRTGPAALVGIGTTVIPVDPDDKSKSCVAAVTSGTGEHMATTMAASTCAMRLLTSTKRGKGGKSVATDEEDAIRHFVETEFMNHPSVQSSHSAGAIGVMAVKKTADGMYLHFAHNTDSFALASMDTEAAEPVCVMSRSRGRNKITTGARGFKYQETRPSKTHRTGTRESRIKKQKKEQPEPSDERLSSPTERHETSSSTGSTGQRDSMPIQNTRK